MQQVYLAWGLFILAVAAQLFFWGRPGPPALAFWRALPDKGRWSVASWVVSASAIAALLWPIVALMALDYDNQPSIFSMLVMVIGSFIVAVIIAGCARFLFDSNVIQMTGLEFVRTVTGVAGLLLILMAVLVAAAYLTALSDPYEWPWS